jgi:hypothetical protein
MYAKRWVPANSDPRSAIERKALRRKPVCVLPIDAMAALAACPSQKRPCARLEASADNLRGCFGARRVATKGGPPAARKPYVCPPCLSEAKIDEKGEVPEFTLAARDSRP